MVKEIITSIRNARTENKIEPSKKIKAVIYGGKDTDLIRSQEVLIKNLRTGIDELEIKETGDKIDNAIFITVGNIEIYLIGAVDEEKEKARVEKEIENLEKLVKSIRMKLDNKEFVDRAPEKIVEGEKQKLETYEIELKKLKEQIKSQK